MKSRQQGKGQWDMKRMLNMYGKWGRSVAGKAGGGGGDDVGWRARGE